MLYTKEIPIKIKTDVFVAGGGPAGVAAAVSAASQGKKVFLAERAGALGGTAVNCYIPIFMAFGDGEHWLCGDVAEKVRNSQSDYRGNDTREYHLHPEVLKRCYDDIVTESGIYVSLFTNLIDVVKKEDKIEAVVLHAKSGIYAVKAAVYVDCTGDGDLCAMAGVPFDFGDANGNTQAPTLCTLWKGIDPSAVERNDPDIMERAFSDGVFTYPDRHFSGLWPTPADPDLAIGNLGHLYGTNGLDEDSLTEAMFLGRKQSQEFFHYYRDYIVDGFEKMALCATAPYLGVRETRRIRGDYQLVLEDFINRASFADEIGRYSYPIDIHESSADIDSYRIFEEQYHNLRYKTGETYGIPYRALIPQTLSNVLVAGRCISTDRYMQSSVRVMPCCLLTGQAAGTAAALAVETKNVRSVKLTELRGILAEHKVWLPEIK